MPKSVRWTSFWAALGAVAASAAVGFAAEPEYEVGGPLAGVKLPLFKGEHGEPDGHPGAIPGKYGTDDLAPQVELYPGSVENYRAYWFKYCPVRSFFDRQSLLKRWVAPDLPGAGKAQVAEYAAPLYWVPRHDLPVDTGVKDKPVAVVRCAAGSPAIKLDLGTLDVGLYAVRVIGAVETAKVRPFREPLYMRLNVNDGLKGEISSYRVRIGYCDEFYSVAEIYFHAVEKRAFRAELSVDAGSKVDLLVREVTLDDALAGTTRAPVKQKGMTFCDPEERAKAKMANVDPKFLARHTSATPEERLARDEALWKWLPPINAQEDIDVIPGVTDGVDIAAAQMTARWGAWEPLFGERGCLDNDGPFWVMFPRRTGYNDFLVNRKLNLTYTNDDRHAGRALPDPYPYKDDGAGLYYPDPNAPAAGRYFSPIAAECTRRWLYWQAIEASVQTYWKTGHEEFARDAAVALVSYAWHFPTMDSANSLSSIAVEPGAYMRENRTRRRITEARFMGSYLSYLAPLYSYDKLFDYIQGNEELAKSVARFVPWVKNSKDVVQLLDVYLVQTTAKRVLRYQFYDLPNAAGEIAVILGPGPVSDQLMNWLFARTFIYPLPPAGIQDLMIDSSDREGAQYIGSTFYAQGEGAIRHARFFDQYMEAGGNPRFDLRDPVRYPKPLAQCFWQLGIMVGGADFLRIGDVTGPDKSPYATVPALEEASRLGWRWSADPRFAWLLKNTYGRKHEADPEWQKIELAAAGVRRAPWLDLRSRVVDNWAGVLETGLAHDDYRFRRAAYVRAGVGIGHAHADTLDLQLFAHGLPMTIDGGQRTNPTYSQPKDRISRIHNVVEVDGADHAGYAWVQTLCDAEGARYLKANAVPPSGATLFNRQMALVDVDEGSFTPPLPPEQQKPGSVLPRNVVTGNSYVFDVFRVAGGKMHSYCFHGPVSDDFQWNAAATAPVKDPAEGAPADEDARYLAPFTLSSGAKLAGRSPELFQATWRYARGGDGAESQMLKDNFDAASPRHFTRLTLLNAAGLRALKADVVTTDACPSKYRFSCVMLKKDDPAGKLESAFAAIIEPYAGEPFIKSARPMDVVDNEMDARRAVAVEVQTVNGRRDLCFADGRPGKVRSIPAANFKVGAEFAYLSTDANGLRQATLTGGTVLEGPGIRLRPQQAERTGKVVQVDYLKRTLWIDQAWPAGVGAGQFEIGVPGRMTGYPAVAVKPDGGRTAITVRGGADFFRSPILKVDAAAGVVQCAIGLTFGVRPGMDKHWVASNERGATALPDAMTTFWRADCVSEDTFKLSGAPVTEGVFGKENVLRLWEYGVGDTVRQSTFVSLRRIGANEYEVTGDVDVAISIGAMDFKVTAEQLGAGPVRIPPK